MANPKLYTMDVFAERRYAGNQLAVVRGAGHCSTEQMQSIALEVGYSETTFLVSDEPREGGYDVRIFTPAEEIPFAGHPTLGTASLIRRELLGGEAGSVVLNLGVGPVAVTFESDVVGDGAYAWMSPPSPTFGATRPPELAAELLGLDLADIDTRTPVEELDIGIAFLMVPLVGRDALRRMSLDSDLQHRLMADGIAVKQVFAFTAAPDDPSNDIAARMFFEAAGTREDPATGSANACLAAYLVRHRYLGAAEVDARVEQGVDMGRPSLILLRASEAGDSVRVAVGGRVVQVSRGELLA